MERFSWQNDSDETIRLVGYATTDRVVDAEITVDVADNPEMDAATEVYPERYSGVTHWHSFGPALAGPAASGLVCRGELERDGAGRSAETPQP
jgi:hypothetical protein